MTRCLMRIATTELRFGQLATNKMDRWDRCGTVAAASPNNSVVPGRGADAHDDQIALTDSQLLQDGLFGVGVRGPQFAGARQIGRQVGRFALDRFLRRTVASPISAEARGHAMPPGRPPPPCCEQYRDRTEACAPRSGRPRHLAHDQRDDLDRGDRQHSAEKQRCDQPLFRVGSIVFGNTSPSTKPRTQPKQSSGNQMPDHCGLAHPRHDLAQQAPGHQEQCIIWHRNTASETPAERPRRPFIPHPARSSRGKRDCRRNGSATWRLPAAARRRQAESTSPFWGNR